MNRILLTLAFLLAFCFTAQAQPDLCTITGTLYKPNGSACASCRIRITLSRKGGIVLNTGTVTVTADGDGDVSFTAVQGSITTLQGDFFLGLVNFASGKEMFIPNSSTADLEDLQTVEEALAGLVGGGGDGAPTDGPYITKTASSSLSNEFALGSLATGILKNTTTTGVPSIAVAGTDYVAPGAATGSGLTMATARILGRTTASTGAIEEITVGSGLSLSGGTLSATGGGGSLAVREVDGSPSVSSVETLEFAQADGFVVTDQTGGVARVAITGIPWANVSKSGSSLADLATRSASDLSSGTLPDGRFPATLPAASGANLTALNASNLGSGTVPLARLSGITTSELSGTAGITSAQLAGSIALSKLSITGTPDGTKYLRDDGSWQAIPGGGDALTSNPLSQFASTTSLQLAGVISNETGSGALVFGTAPTIAGGSVTGLTAFGVRSSGSGAFDLQIANSEDLTDNRALTIKLNDAARTIDLGGNLTTSGSVTLSGSNTGDQTITLTGDVTGSGTGSFAATIANDAVTDGKLRNSAALSVIGRASNSSGDPADIAAGSDGHVLRRSGTSLGFGEIATAGIGDSQVTNAKLANSAITIAGTSTALGASITLDTITGLSTTGVVKRTGANTLAIGSVDLTAEVTGDLPFSSFVQAGSAGFVGATGSGDYAHRTPTQVTAALDAFVGDSGSGGTKGLVPAPTTGDATKYLKGDGTWATVSASPAGSTGDYQINNGGSFGAGVIAQSSGRLTATPTAASSGSASYFRVITPVDTGQTASTESIGLQFGGNTSAATVTRTWAAGALTTQRENVFVAPTYAFASASTITTAVNVDASSPIAGTNATLTKSVAVRANASNAAHVPLVANGATSQSANIFETQINGSTSGTFIVTSTGAPSSPGAGSSSERYGSGAVAAGNNSVAIGNGASSAGANSVAIGLNATTSSSTFQIAVGSGSSAAGSTAIAMGANASASGSTAISIGVNQTVSGANSVNIGGSGNLSGQGSFYALAAGTVRNATIAIGAGAAPTADNQAVFATSGGANANGIGEVYFGKGVTSATPTAYTINGTGGSGTNIAGAAVNIAGGKATGNAAGGVINFQTSDVGASGTTLQSLTTKVTIQVDGGITQTGVTFANLGTPANGTLIYCSDCTIASPCASGGTGALAKRLNSAWVCN
jgi:hypothetical protein